jgi:flagella basal body P-ring formation protein FlgA
MKSAVFIIFLLVISLFANTQIILRDSSAVAGDIIKLEQIADVSGKHKKLLDTMFVANAEPSGHSRFLMKTSISLPADIKDEVEVIGADRIKIHTLSQKISYAELAEKANALLIDSLTNNEKIKSQIMFEFNEDAKLDIALGNYEVELGKIDRQRLRGRVLVPVVVVQNNGKKKTRASINAVVKVTATVCVATKDIARHEKVALANVEMKTLDITTLQGNPLYEMPAIDDYQVIGAIRTGTVITNRHVSPKPLVEQGTPVRMTTGAGMVKVAIWGRARSSGGIGDIIAVENIESSRIVRAKIITSETVEIVRGGTI